MAIPSTSVMRGLALTSPTESVDRLGRNSAMSINPVVQVAQQVLLGGAVKQNHALEHATIVLLSQKYPNVRLAGISFAAGFFVFGDVPTEAIIPTANEALTL